MKPLHFLVPGDLDTPTGGYRYDRRIIQGLETRGHGVVLHRLDDSFPTPDDTALSAAAAVLATIPDAATVVIDGLALAPLLEQLHPRHRLVALIHHPLASETGLGEALRASFRQREREALRRVVRVIVTSPATARELQADYDVACDRIAVVVPGTERVPDPPPPPTDGPLQMLCVATLTPRKGHRVLLKALAPMAHQDWFLSCVGSLERDPDTVAALHRQLDETGLRDRVRLVGAVEPTDLDAFYRRAGLFVLPSFHEGYGMVLAEALSFGLPIVSTTVGAIPDTVPSAAGILVPPGDHQSLYRTLSLLVEQPSHRLALAAAARRAAQQLPSWDDAIQRFARELPGDCHHE